MKRFLPTLMVILLASHTTFAAENGLAEFIAHLNEPWAQFFVIGAALTSIPLLVLIVIMIRGLFNQRQFYPQRTKAKVTSSR